MTLPDPILADEERSHHLALNAARRTRRARLRGSVPAGHSALGTLVQDGAHEIASQTDPGEARGVDVDTPDPQGMQGLTAAERDGVDDGNGLSDDIWLVLLDGHVLDVVCGKEAALDSAELLIEVNRSVGRIATVEVVMATAHYS